MAGTAHNTVKITGNPVCKEYLSGVTLTVGQTVQLNSSNQLIASAVAAATYEGGQMVVTEAPERGKGILTAAGAVNTYVAGELVPTAAPYQGCEMLILVLDGQTITAGGLLEINSAGKAIAAAGSELPAWRALESLSPSGTDGLIHAQKL